jgi:hypothetical protein
MVREALMRIIITTKATKRLEKVPQPPPLRSACRGLKAGWWKVWAAKMYGRTNSDHVGKTW